MRVNCPGRFYHLQFLVINSFGESERKFNSLPSLVLIFCIQHTRHTRSTGSAEFTALLEPEHLFRKNPVEEIVETSSEEMGDQSTRRTVSNYAKSTDGGVCSSITQPTVEANSWQFPSHIMSTIATNVQFHGNSHENPHSHLTRFSRVCDIFRLNGVTEDAKLLCLFPFSLADKAATWRESLPNGSITTWAAMKDKFLAKYYPLLRLPITGV
ncbi:hypothetical protein L1987_45627 [Smallanthus sonchifolius]|uniref:Uncharacterized protein n=1 Tax=Smallanthus sonchifolius TaxID=185202 RepID=A0ACB9FYJ5_9ASTR|nr:hypothetical protein L1987_45627 [Smallanthus sonchifolius]